jgi:hypothetical protein
MQVTLQGPTGRPSQQQQKQQQPEVEVGAQAGEVQQVCASAISMQQQTWTFSQRT